MAEENSGTGSGPEEAFALLADETRLRIVRALGDAGGDGEYTPLAFSELQNAVGVQDNGKFNYHLKQLVGRFVERTAGGYTLRVPGILVYQAVKAGTYTEHEEIGPMSTSVPCKFCDEPLEASYREFRAHVGCPNCELEFYSYPLEPESFGDDLPADLVRAADRRLKRDHVSMHHGFCPYCVGVIRTKFEADSDRLDALEAADGEYVTVTRTCERCHWFLHFGLLAALWVHPQVAGTFWTLGVDTSQIAYLDPDIEAEETVYSVDPWRVEQVVSYGDVRVRVLVDGDLDVLEVESLEVDSDDRRHANDA